MWFVCAILSAVFAAATSILAKVGIEGVGSNLATAIRTMVVVVMAWVMVLITNQQGGISEITPKSWLFLCLSGLATGASWLFYYRAIQIGEVSKVVPIDKLSVVITLILAFAFLHEKFTWKCGRVCAHNCGDTYNGAVKLPRIRFRAQTPFKKREVKWTTKTTALFAEPSLSILIRRKRWNANFATGYFRLMPPVGTATIYAINATVPTLWS